MSVDRLPRVQFTPFEWVAVTVVKFVCVSVPFVAVGFVNAFFGDFS